MTAAPVSPLTAARRTMLSQQSRPAWFDPAITAVLDGAESLTSARGPREVEVRTAESLGARLHRVLREDADGLWFAWWFEELVAAAADRVREGNQPALWLLHGLTSIGTPVPASLASEACSRLPGGDVPAWLGDLGRVAATGEAHLMRDVYGTRFAVLAAFAYGDGADPFVYLFDIDASGFVKLAGAGDFDDVGAAAAAWVAAVGDAAGDARPQPVENAGELLCLAHVDVGDEMVMGDEPRVVMDNWFRARRRIHDLFAVFGTPPVESLYHGIDITPMTEQFTSWYAGRHGSEPDAESVEALAAEWTEGALPETWYSVSPQRIEFLLGLIGDWIQDPITSTVRSLLPDWVEWLSERTDLPEPCRAQVRQALAAGRQVPAH